MDSSFMATPTISSANPLDTMMQSLRAQIAAEVKSDITAEIIDRVVRVVANSLQTINLNAQVTVPPSTVQVNSTPALVDVEMNMDEMCASMTRIESLLSQLITTMQAPVQRTVARNSENLIQSVTERRI